MSFGKTTRIHLADGSPTGIKHAELVNWTGQAMVCPRSRVAELGNWPECTRPGVYLLVGEDADQGRELTYVGEAENVFERLKGHLRNKDFWRRVVFFTSKDDNLTKAHVKYLEARIVELARTADRSKLENGATPQLPTLPRAERDAMEEFLESLRILLGALGFSTLQPVAAKPETSSQVSGPLAKIALRFNPGNRVIDAQGASTDEGFVVLRGSKGDPNVGSSLSKGYRDLRESLINDGAIVADAKAIQFSRDVLFSSPSAAAAVLAGGAYNGREAWKAKDSKSLKQLEEDLAGGN